MTPPTPRDYRYMIDHRGPVITPRLPAFSSTVRDRGQAMEFAAQAFVGDRSGDSGAGVDLALGDRRYSKGAGIELVPLDDEILN